jgi:hypothetical protein
MTTSEKLTVLAGALEAGVNPYFEQASLTNCAVGTGNRLDLTTGVLNARMYSGVTRKFVEKFGVTEQEADAILVADYHLLGIRMREYRMADVTPQIAAKALRALARKYARQGN